MTEIKENVLEDWIQHEAFHAFSIIWCQNEMRCSEALSIFAHSCMFWCVWLGWEAFAGLASPHIAFATQAIRWSVVWRRTKQAWFSVISSILMRSVVMMLFFDVKPFRQPANVFLPAMRTDDVLYRCSTRWTQACDGLWMFGSLGMQELIRHHGCLAIALNSSGMVQARAATPF